MTASTAAQAQRRLHLALRALHGPAAGDVWNAACRQAGVLSLGTLSPPELLLVADVLLTQGGATAVAAGSCRVLLISARPAARAPAPRPPRADAEAADLELAALQEALRVEDALTPDEGSRRLSRLADTRT
jgi:hypothetical protein